MSQRSFSVAHGIAKTFSPERKIVFSVLETCGPSPTELWTPSFGDLLPVEGWKGVWDGSESALLPPESQGAVQMETSVLCICATDQSHFSAMGLGVVDGEREPSGSPLQSRPPARRSYKSPRSLSVVSSAIRSLMTSLNKET